MSYITDKLAQIAENVPKVYQAGRNEGIKSQDAYKEGVKSAYDEFWDAYQNNGKPILGAESYFGSEGWHDANFKPKYSMGSFTRADNFFRTSKITNIKKCLEDAGVVFDFSKNKNFQYTFAYCKTTELPVIDMSQATNMNYTFYYDESLVSIDKLILPNNSTAYSQMFYRCTSLVNLPVEGTISANGLDLQWSTKLSKESITSIINALSGKTSGLTVTLSKTAVDEAFRPVMGSKPGSETAQWTELIAPKIDKGWTISLV